MLAGAKGLALLSAVRLGAGWSCTAGTGTTHCYMLQGSLEPVLGLMVACVFMIYIYPFATAIEFEQPA